MNEPEIKITSLIFEKAGRLSFEGTVDGQSFGGEFLSCHKDFEKILPKEDFEYEFRDQDSLCNAVMDDFFNLHWSIKFGGSIISRVVRLEEIVKNALYELYTKSK